MFGAPEETMVWELHRTHAQTMAVVGEPGMHDVVASSKPLTYPDAPPADMGESLRWMAQTVHQAYHGDEVGGFDKCPRPLCIVAARTLRVHGYEVSVSSVFPAVRGASGVGGSDQGAHADEAQPEEEHRLGHRPVD